MHLYLLLTTALALSCCKTMRQTPSKPSPQEGNSNTPTAATGSFQAPLASPGANSPPPAASEGEKAELSTAAGPILKKMVGALSKEDPKAQHYECLVSATDISNLEQVKQWIAEVEKAPLVEAYHFRATIPSIQIFAYAEGREVLLFESYSMAKYRRPVSDSDIKNDTAEELMKLANQKCPYP